MRESGKGSKRLEIKPELESKIKVDVFNLLYERRKNTEHIGTFP